MAPDERVVEAATRCLVILRNYRDGERTEATKARMVAEIEMIVGWLIEMNVFTRLAREFIRSSVKDHLVARYGVVVGLKLDREFAGAFGSIQVYPLAGILKYSNIMSSQEILN